MLFSKSVFASANILYFYVFFIYSSIEFLQVFVYLLLLTTFMVSWVLCFQLICKYMRIVFFWRNGWFISEVVIYKVVMLNTHFQIRFDIFSLLIYALHYCSICSKIFFKVFHTKNARDSKKLNVSYTNHMLY